MCRNPSVYADVCRELAAVVGLQATALFRFIAPTYVHVNGLFVCLCACLIWIVVSTSNAKSNRNFFKSK